MLALGDRHPVQHVSRAVVRAYDEQSKLPPGILALPGYSSAKVRHLLNNLCDFPSCRYLEIGTWKGSTVLSASYRNAGSFVAVDDFSQFDGPRAECEANRLAWKDDCRFVLHDAGAWQLDLETIGPVNVYFYDGGHADDEQYLAFSYFDPILQDPFIAIVDDWNWPQVRSGTRRAFRDLKYHVAGAWELRTPGNGDVDSWWNGIMIAVVQKAEPA